MAQYEKYKKMIDLNKDLDDETKSLFFHSIDNLCQNGLPVILNHYHLSNLIGIEYKALMRLIHHRDEQYEVFYIAKRRGGKRMIIAPNADMSLVQNYIKQEILEQIKIHECAYGFTPSKNIIKNAQQHIYAEKILNLDLKDFFPSISYKRIFYIFYHLCGYTYAISTILANLCIYKGILPQGACTSPILSNIVSYKMDLRLSNYCKKANITYTRYADDMTFSGTKNVINKGLYHAVKKIIMDCDFNLNEDKTRFASSNRRMEVTGLVINNQKVSIHKKYIKQVRQELYYLNKYGINEHQKVKKFKNHFYREHVKGKILFIRQVDLAKGEALLKEYDRIEWSDEHDQ